MNRNIAIILCASMLLFFIGCAKDPATANSTTVLTTTTTIYETTPTVITEPGSATVYDSSMAAVSLPLITEVHRKGESDIAYYTHQDVSITLPDADVAQTITLDLLNRIDKTRSMADSVFAAADATYSNQESWYPYSYSIIYEPMRLDENVLSFFVRESSFDGSPRSVNNTLSVTYDLTTGEALNLKTILHEENFADALCDLILESLKEKSSDLFPDYETLVREKFSTNVTVSNWYFSQKGLCFFFTPYEIAPYSAGTIVAQIPYSNLSGLMKDAYFPGEQLQTEGDVLVQKLEDFSITEKYEQFARVTLTPDHDKLLISSDGSITNIRITYAPQESGSGVMDSVILSLAGMGPTDAILLELDLKTSAQQISITFDSFGQSQTLYLKEIDSGDFQFLK